MHLRRGILELPRFFDVSEGVRQALNATGTGIVALESTVITHGLPYPNNLETAKSLEQIIRSEGSIPATIALMDGRIRIGLTEEELERIAKSQNSSKVSRRDIAHTLVRKAIGGTTVAATMLLAEKVGIKVFATGGIGGVHRGAESSFDISADLQELSRTPVTVVCAGVKSILDIPKTVEYMETHSINCIVYGPKNVFPGFFTAQTSSRAQFNTESLEDVVNVINTSATLGLEAGTVLACPIPAAHEADGAKIEAAIQQALKESKKIQICSQDVTPFILSKVNQLTQGASMKTNVALLQNNARIAGKLARLMAESSQKHHRRGMHTSSFVRPKVTVIGATIVDFEAITNQEVKDDGGSYVGIVTQRCGGVGRNHADALARLGCDSWLISTIGDDSHGKYIRDRCNHINLSRVVEVPNVPTATYMSMNVKGNIRYGVSSIEEIVGHITPEMISKNEDVISTSDYVLIDGNVPIEALKRAIDIATFHSKKIWFEPTDVAKMRKIFDSQRIHLVHATSPNANEFREMAKYAGLPLSDAVLSSAQAVGQFILKNSHLMNNLDILLVSLADRGCAVVRRAEDELVLNTLPPPTTNVVSVSGAGDSLNSGILAALLHGYSWPNCLAVGQLCARLTLETTEAVSPLIEPQCLVSESQERVIA